MGKRRFLRLFLLLLALVIGEEGFAQKRPEGKTSIQKKTSKKKEKETIFWLDGGDNWPILSEEKDREVVEGQKQKMELIRQTFSRNSLVLYESEHFLYLTDAPPRIAKECVEYLERMHVRLREIFGLPETCRVWYGKGMVVAFLQQSHFQQFEAHFFQTQNTFSEALGLAHLMGDGNVLISLYYGDISQVRLRWRFIATLVHEMTHGFVHRYQSPKSLPLWLDEGMADYIAGQIVPACPEVKNKQREALSVMRRSYSVGGMMGATTRLEPWQYGVASGLVDFLLRKDARAFPVFLQKIKAGLPWPQALVETYRGTPEQLLRAFGQENRLPRLDF
ncbi:MAG: hypothetical protein Q4E67_05360 [Planctomycetia bacterium]|nr:hypothetical protein [Planctomycetia bacterium]